MKKDLGEFVFNSFMCDLDFSTWMWDVTQVATVSNNLVVSDWEEPFARVLLIFEAPSTSILLELTSLDRSV